MFGFYAGAVFSAILALICGFNAGAYAEIKANSTFSPAFTEYFARQLIAAAWLFSILAIVLVVFASFLY